MKKKQDVTLPKRALNVAEKQEDGSYNVYQLYGPMKILLLKGAKNPFDAFDRLDREYYERE